MIPNSRALAVVVLAAVAKILHATDGEFETPPDFHAADVLRPELLAGDHFKIDEAVRNGGYLNHFVIHSDYGDFEASGQTMLEIRLKEVAALARIAEISKTDVFIRAAKNAAVDMVVQPVKAAQSITSDPIGTVTRLPRGIGRLFSHYAEEGSKAVESAKNSATSIVSGEPKDSVASDFSETGRSAAKSVLSIGSAERRWSQQLGTDPYSTNETLRKAIENVAWFDGAGRLAPSLAGIPSIPGGGELVRVNELAWDDPRSVRAKSRERLVAMKIPEADADAFLDRSSLTPTHQLALLASLEALDGVAGREELLRQAMDKKSEPEIWFHLNSVRLLETLRREGLPVVGIVPGTRLTMAGTSDHRLVVTLGLDHLVWTQDIDKIAQHFKEVVAPRNDASMEVWITGTASDRAKAELANLGLALHERPLSSLAGN